MRRVVVTGLGAVTPLGIGVQSTWQRLIESACGIRPLSPDYHPQGHWQRARIAGLVPAEKWHKISRSHFSGDELRRLTRYMQYGSYAAHEALQDAGLLLASGHEQARTGVCLGAGIGSLQETYDAVLNLESTGHKRISPLFVPRLLVNIAAAHISMKYGFGGPSHAVSTACTTGAHSIGDASRFIAFGDADVMIAGGAESCIHPLAFVGFERSRSLCYTHNDDPSQASRPFDKGRSGFVISEGAGVVVLEELEHALSRKASIYAELVGYGLSSDAHHLTAPRIDGGGALRALQQSLKHAQVAPSQIDYINAHATSTPLGDIAEIKALRSLMQGSDGHRHAEDVNVSSSKGAMGHLLGAAGAVEAIISILAIHHGILPPTLNLSDPEYLPDFKCNYVAQVAQPKHVEIALSNSFGFGGTNASLCFRRFRR